MRHMWIGALMLGLLPAFASAGHDRVHFSVGFSIGLPHIGIGIGGYDCYRPRSHRYYYGPAYYGSYSSVYAEPAPVYVAPEPVYAAPPAVVYQSPPPVVYGQPFYVPPPVYAPAVTYEVGPRVGYYYARDRYYDRDRYYYRR